MKFHRALALALVALLAAPAAAQPRQEALTLDRAIEIALVQQPSVRITRASIEQAQARIQSARVALKPTVSLQGSLAVGSSRQFTDTTTNTSSGGFFDPTLSTGFSASAGWRIYDFGQTSAAIRAAEANADATAASIGTTNLDIRSSVAIAYLEAFARARLVVVAETTVKSEEVHLDQARRFVAAQAKDPIEVVQAQARAANARSALAQSQSNAAVALSNLRSAIGWLDPQVTFTVDGTWPTPPAEDPAELTVLVDGARKHRPELVQLDKEIIAADAGVTVAQAERRPLLSAQANTQWGPSQNDWSPQPTWTAGLTLSWQLYDGGRSAADVRAARAQVMGAQAQRDQLLVSLTSELDAARAQIIANRANTVASNEAVTAARAQLKLADARYTQGLGSQIELADAQTAVTTAEGNLITAEWQLAEAWARLKRALGQQ
ncbi:TolC family protein [soil metagenome]